jgi:hypothetical protein
MKALPPAHHLTRAAEHEHAAAHHRERARRLWADLLPDPISLQAKPTAAKTPHQFKLATARARYAEALARKLDDMARREVDAWAKAKAGQSQDADPTTNE